MKQIITHSAGETSRAGEELAAHLGSGDVIALFGGLGAGKTAFVRGLAAGLAVTGEVSSPTFALVHVYEGELPLFHFDMYRVDSWDDLETTGYFDYLQQTGIVAVEWSENIENALPERVIRVEITPGKMPSQRIITVTGAGKYADFGD